MTAKEFATKHAGKITKCHATKSPPIIGDNGKALKTFNARIIGWKDATGADPAFVALEVLAPGKTKFLVAHMKSGYHWTYKADQGAYAKKLLVEEVDTPSSSASVSTSDWPHKCRDCGSPAQIFLMRIDCSNSKCHHKYKTSDATDLFIPRDVKPEIKKVKKKPAKK
jgi:hypothetical protein